MTDQNSKLGILLLPVPKDSTQSFRGSGKTPNLNKVLLQERKQDKERENKKWFKLKNLPYK